jgi:hypothetical protein
VHNYARDIALYILTLAVNLPKVAKASTIVAVTCRYCQHYHLKYNANVNYPLDLANIYLSLEEVTVRAGHKVLV